MTAGFFIAADNYPRNLMIWAGDPADPAPRPMLARYDIVSTEDDEAGKELWGRIVAAVENAPPDRAGGSLSEDDAA